MSAPSMDKSGQKFNFDSSHVPPMSQPPKAHGPTPVDGVNISGVKVPDPNQHPF